MLPFIKLKYFVLEKSLQKISLNYEKSIHTHKKDAVMMPY